MHRRFVQSILGIVAVLALLCTTIFHVSCTPGGSSTVVEQTLETCSTEACHGGIENIHPLFQLTCVDCHGGDGSAPEKNNSHVARPANFGRFPLVAGTHTDNTTFLRGPRMFRENGTTATEEGFGKPESVNPAPDPIPVVADPNDGLGPDHSDENDPANLAYRRFLNPGDLLVANISCGRGFPREAGKCHGDIYDRVTRSLHATSAGLVSGAFYINSFRRKFAGFENYTGDDRDKDAFVCAFLPKGQPLVDPDFDQNITGTVQQIIHEVPVDNFNNRDVGVARALAGQPGGINIDDDFMFRMMKTYITTDCTRCHLYTEGAKRAGEFRSAGCSACHVYYSNEGTSITGDISISKVETDHPYRHEMQRYPPDEQCIHCHNRGGRHGSEFHGLRERPQGFKDQLFNDFLQNDRVNDSAIAGGRTGGFFPKVPRFFLARSAANALVPPQLLGDFFFGREYLQSKLWGRDTGRTDGNNFLIRDEDRTNTIDETPADVHQARGMKCVDCHTREELHGDGHIYSDRFHEHEIECESCHGTPTKRSGLTTRKGRAVRGLTMDANGQVFQELVPNQGREDTSLAPVKDVRKVLQLPDVLTPGNADFNPRSVGACDVHSDGPSSTDPNATGIAALHPDGSPGRLECFSCHSAWANNCLSCHMMLDYGPARSGDTNVDGVLDKQEMINQQDNFAVNYYDNIPRFGVQRQPRYLTVPDHLVLGLNYENRISIMQIGGQAVVFASSNPNGSRGPNDNGAFAPENFILDPALLPDPDGDPAQNNGTARIPARTGMTNTLRNFVFVTNDNGRFLPSFPLNQNFPHTVQTVPRNCDNCHPNPNLSNSLERRRQLELVDKAVGIGNGLRRANGVGNAFERISTALVYDDPVSVAEGGTGTGDILKMPFATGTLANLRLRFRELNIRRENLRIFSANQNGGATDFFIDQLGVNAQEGSIVDINLDEFIRITPDPTVLDNNGLQNYQINTIQQQRPTTHRNSRPLDARGIQKLYNNLIVPQARDSSDSQ